MEVKNLAQFKTTQNNTKQETKSSFTYDRYSDYSYQLRGYNEEKSERHHCKNTYCNRSIDSYEYKNYDGEANLVIVYLTIDKYKIIYYYLLFLLFKLYF